MVDEGETNVGALARERYGADECFLIGLTTYAGQVTAASQWDGPAEHKRVRPALAGSHEALLHAMGVPRFVLDLHEPAARDVFSESRLERAIGVIYQPETERASHYFRARLAQQFDALIHVDETHAVEPLERSPEWLAAEAPETYPSAL